MSQQNASAAEGRETGGNTTEDAQGTETFPQGDTDYGESACAGGNCPEGDDFDHNILSEEWFGGNPDQGNCLTPPFAIIKVVFFTM